MCFRVRLEELRFQHCVRSCKVWLGHRHAHGGGDGVVGGKAGMCNGHLGTISRVYVSG